MAGRCGCGRTCSCCQSTSPSVAVAGSGSAGQCYTSSVRYSTDPGNRAKAGTDGAVFADTCLLGPDGEALVPNGAGCITLPAPCVLDYNGDPIEPDEDGCVQLPTSGVPPDFACGLETDEDGALMVATTGAAWPQNDLAGAAFGGAYTDAGALFCDPDGKIRGLPDHTVVNVGASETLESFTVIPVPGTYTSPGSAVLAVANPSPARRLSYVAFVVLIVDAATELDGGAIVRVQTRTNGGAWTTGRELRWPTGLTSVRIRSKLEATARLAGTIPAGGALTFETRAQVAKDGSGDDDPTVIEVLASTRFLGVTV